MLRLLTGSAAVRVAGAVAQLAFTLVVARVAGAHQAGIFFFGYSILMVLASVSRLGLELSILREIANRLAVGDKRGARAALGSRVPAVTYLSLALATGLAIASPQVANFSFSGVTPTLLFIAAAIPPFALLGVATEALKACDRAWLALAFQNLLIPAIVVPSLVIISFSHSVVGRDIAALLLCAGLLTFLLAWSIVNQTLGGDLSRGLSTLFILRRSDLEVVLSEARHLLVVSLASVIMQWFGSAALGFGAGPEAVAGYAIASRLAIAVSIIHSAASSVMGPRMAVAYVSQGVDSFRCVVQQTGVLITSITWPILTFIMLFSAHLMSVFGSQYVQYALVLQILLIGQFVAAVIGHSGMVLVMTGCYKEARRNSVAALGILSVGSVALIPVFGARGAAMAMSLSVICGHLYGLALVRSRLHIWTLPSSVAELRGVLSR